MAKLKVRVVYITWVGMIIIRNTLFLQNSWMTLRKSMTNKSIMAMNSHGTMGVLITKLVNGNKIQALWEK